MEVPLPDASQRHIERPTAMVRSSSPGSASSSPQKMLPGAPNPFTIASSARGPGLSAPLPHLGSRSPGGYNPSVYSYPYSTSSTSPSATSGSLQETQISDAPTLSATGISPTQISSSNLNAQKRAYRQRRKDPSCDACRERKVKCDATDTSACSECSSRNHKCLFTKETNRRMSSIKQVQDLQSQLAELRQENTTLRTRFPDRDPSEREGGSAKNRRVDKQVQQTKAPQKISPPLLRDFDHVRKNIKLHSTGIFGFPSTDHSIVETATNVASRPELPSRTHFAHLSRAYLDTIHESFPVLHWPIFQHEVDQAYTARTLQGLPRPWIGLFFAVLACGTLQSSPGAQGLGSAFYEASSGALAPPSQYTTMEHIQGAFLLSIFATESGMKSAGSIWLASAVRMGQIIGLDKDIDRSLFEVEMRRRLWWSIRSWDRISSSNTNLPMLVVGDTDMPLPSSLEDRYIQRQGYTRLPTTQSPSTRFVALFDVASILSTLANALRSSMITRTSLQSYDDLFHSKSMNLQGSCHPESDAPIEPAALPILITLQFARFLLYRRNLSPTCQPADRLDALQRCSSVARNTATYISRTLAATPAEKDWRLRIGLVASNMMCTHLWRCTLMLCLRAEYEAALMCVKTSSAIGDIRQVNVACGKNLAFFLECLLDRVHSGNGSVHQLEHDEEMLAYVSGDLQGDREQAWVWNDSDLRSDQITNPSVRPRSMQRRGSDEQMQDSSSLPLRSVPTSPESGAKGWDGWARIERMIRQLEEYRARLAQPSPYYPPPHNPVKRVQLAPGAPASPPSSGPQVPSSSTSRISIANII